jgi:hypothetical protein
LFVGESPPYGGTFFYLGNSKLYDKMRSVIESKLDKTDDFLATFKSYGWYLDDLVLTPVNQKERAERRKMCRNAQASLAKRIASRRALSGT